MTHAPVRDLRETLARLRRSGDVVEIDAPVDSNQEIPEIHRRVIAAGGPALLFKNVKGSPFPVLTNLFGTPERIGLAFGERPVEFVESAVRLAREAVPPTPAKLWAARSTLAQALKIGTKKRAGAPVAEVCEEPSLNRLPMLTSWPEDGGPFVTLPLVMTESPADGTPNLGMYRMHRFDERRTGMHWQIGKGGGFHYAEAEAQGKALPVTVFLGGPPALMLSAVAPLPEGVPEMLLASMLLGERIGVTQVPESPHRLFAGAEFALIGSVAPAERHPEGPFGDHYGYYSLEHPYPVFECSHIRRRADAIYPATVVGKPRQEDYYLGEYLQRLLSPLFPLVMPGVRDLWTYGETGFHALAAAVVRERYPREAMMSAFRILGEGQLSLTKFLLLTDQPMELSDFPSLLSHVLARCCPETDLHIFGQLSQDTLDYTGPAVNKGSKGVMLGLGPAIRPLEGEWRGNPPAGARDPRVFCPGCLVVGGPSYESDANFAQHLAADPALEDWPLVVVSDDSARATASTVNFLWTTFTRFEPAGDIYARETRFERHHAAYRGPLVIDARMKPWYPGELFCDQDVARLVDGRWSEYFPAGGVEMGSSDLAHLSPA